MELVRNRIRMAARLGSNVIIMHLPDLRPTGAWDALRKSLSSYNKWVSMESTMANSGMIDEPAWLAAGFQAGTKLAGMVAAHLTQS